MGCTVSRNSAISDRDRQRFGSRRRLGKSSSFTPLRSTRPNDLHYDYHVVALTSSTYGIMKLLESENVNERLVSAIGGGGPGEGPRYSKMKKSDSMPPRERAPKTWTDMAMGYSRFKLEQIKKDEIEAKQPVQKQEKTVLETSETETINAWELMEGLDDNTPLASPLTTTTVSTQESGLELMEKVAKVALAPTVNTLPRSRSLSAVDGLRMLNKVGIVPDLLAMESISSTQVSINHSFDFSNRRSNSGSMDFSTRGSMDFSQRNSGPLSSSGLPSGLVMGFPVSNSGFAQTVFPTVSDCSHDEVTDSLFDPDILATFQEAADERSSDDDWCHIRSSDGEVSTASSTAGENSLIQYVRAKKTAFSNTSHICDSSRADSHPGTYGPRKTSSAKVAPVDNVDSRWTVIVDPLSQFEERCPPGGEDRVVLYLTSLRGIRKTFEDCHNLRMILQSFAVWIDERDVSMHAEFRQELQSLADGPVTVPRLFVKGHYIGGSDAVRRIHEDGKLGGLLQDLPVVNFRKACDGCGGVRFVPCPDCSGSCKIITDDNEVARCPDCNENGLIRCPVCF